MQIVNHVHIWRAAAQEMPGLAAATDAGELESATRALNTLKKSDITELKALKAPPYGITLTIEAVHTLLGLPYAADKCVDG